ncbi:helix-turn-helix domain-containing protein [Pseudomonas gingeri]|uniref:helix-turn-helix domain-containing protein n=1 Tax=Pseudomonas gingeri TaxID=117681 RepID=UPI0015A3CA3E|nr:helix-turn-helix domain-containing protein [Pseudomonas gingeri]NVZ62498.1 helix-turn-helix domain-containing protein [Pseudomonas gingeri]NVZ75803.1 helix-turn-helix domain-containing protein [Pseudomonas gingeri]NWA09836.1 helix-turn-helix domain-containing protein [Pseudomonas gingeri]NWE46674.1 helix-turn-helix domain-containing protein [Pseudomonas gingeri]
MYVRAGETGVCLCHDDLRVGWCLPAGWQGLLVGRAAMRVVSGGLLCESLSGTCLMKLQVFIDMGGGFAQRRPCAEPWAALPVTAAIAASKEGLERWYIERALRGDADYRRFAGMLRQSASYWLVQFLLEQGTASEKLIGLARRYGVSVSHFRRLCHQALGGAAKPELRDWRTAKALLRMIRGGGSLTDVALEYGYASSSHFSKEVRELLGVAPSRLLDLMEQRG